MVLVKGKEKKSEAVKFESGKASLFSNYGLLMKGYRLASRFINNIFLFVDREFTYSTFMYVFRPE